MRRAPRERERSAARERLRRDAVGHSQLGVVLRRDPAREAAAEHEPVDRLACELRCSTTCTPGGASARHSAWLPWVAPLVRNQVRSRPVGVGGELLGPLIRRRRGTDVDPLDVLWEVEQQRALPERAAQAGVRALPRPCGRARGSASSRGSRNAVTASRYGAVGCAGGATAPAPAAALVTRRPPSPTRPPQLLGGLVAGTPARSRRGRRRAPGWHRPSRSRCGGP